MLLKFLCFSCYPNNYFEIFPLFFISQFYMCIHILFLHFFPIPAFWIPVFQRALIQYHWAELHLCPILQMKPHSVIKTS
jgi:hypothetical protein